MPHDPIKMADAVAKLVNQGSLRRGCKIRIWGNAKSSSRNFIIDKLLMDDKAAAQRIEHRSGIKLL